MKSLGFTCVNDKLDALKNAWNIDSNNNQMPYGTIETQDYYQLYTN